MPDPIRPPQAPAAAPQPQKESDETQEIMRRYRSRKQIYPDIKTKEDLERKDYNGLVEPLEKNDKELPNIETEFLKKVREVEGFMGAGNLADFSFNSIKQIPAHKPVCESLESKIKIIQQSAAANPPPPPDLEALFRAKDSAEFNANLNDQRIVNSKYLQDNEFKAKTLAVFNSIKAYKDQNAGTIKQQAVRTYLNEILKAGNIDKVDQKIKDSTIIRESLITPEYRLKIRALHEEYLKYRDRMRRQIELEVIIDKEKNTILTSPQEYARSAEKFIADKIQSVRENWAGMDGKERFIAGATMLIGLSWFLDSKHESVSEIRSIFKKLGFVGLGYLAVNTGTKLVTGKTAAEMTKSYIEDRSGKRNFLKDAFDTDKHGAEVMNSALVNMGPYDFNEIAESYLRQQAQYKTHPVADNQRELPMGGIAEDQMHPRDIYLAMKLFERKLEKEGTSLEKMIKAIKDEEKECKAKNKPFTRPTFALILTAVLQKDILKHQVEDGKITLTQTDKIDVPYDPAQKAATRKWWMLTGTPQDWKRQHYKPDSFPKEGFSDENTKRISSSYMDIKKPLSSIMQDQYFGRYTAGFKSLYDLQMKDKESEKIHMLPDTKDNTVYISSRVPVDYKSFEGHTRDYPRVAAVRNAYDEALKAIDAKYGNGNTAVLKAVKSRINEFVHPVYGVFLTESEKGKPAGPIKEYVMFLRLVLPGSVEYALREKNEWPDGDMIQMMGEKPMNKGDKLTKADFEILAQEHLKADAKLPKFTLGITFTTSYGGAYECFLTNLRINKSDTKKIEKALDYFNNLYAGSGLSKLGLVRFLASHKFTEKEIKAIFGQNEFIPNEGIDLRTLVDAKTKEAQKELEDLIKKKQEEYDKMEQNLPAEVIKANKLSAEISDLKDNKQAWDIIIRTGFDKFFIALCNGDDKAIGIVSSKFIASGYQVLAQAFNSFIPATLPGNESTKGKIITEATKAYKNIILNAGQSKDLLTKIMEVVEDFRKPA